MFFWSTKRIYTLLTVLLAVIMTAVPAIAIIPTPSAEKTASSGRKFAADEMFKVLITDTGKVSDVPYADYLLGTVAAEMGADAPVEALKAQTVACYTYALYRKQENAGKEYDITDSPDTDQKYLSREQLKEKWGKNYETYEKKISDAVSQAAGYALTDGDGEPILAAYHAVSSGRTESAEVVWGEKYSYLQPVESIGDLLSPDYLSIRTFTAAELKEKLAKEVTLEGEPSGWLGEVTCSESGTVISMVMGDKTVSGDSLRDKLGLRSAAFDVAYSEDGFTFNVKGWGHGVGMSQYGARYLADTGSTFIEILGHYYTGCKMQML